MNVQSQKRTIFWLVGGIVVTALFLFPLFSPDTFRFVETMIGKYPYAAALIIVVSKFLAAVLAPLPGAPIAIASLTFLPWWKAALYNFIGSEIGVVCAFFIARRFRAPVVAYVAPLKKIHEWQGAVSRQRQFWTFIAFRLFSQAAFDMVAYAAGLTKIPFRIFLAAILLVDAPIHIAFFYFGGLAIRYSIYLTVLGGGVLLIFLTIVKKRTVLNIS